MSENVNVYMATAEKPSKVSHCRHNSGLNLQRIKAANTTFEAVAYKVNNIL